MSPTTFRILDHTARWTGERVELGTDLSRRTGRHPLSELPGDDAVWTEVQRELATWCRANGITGRVEIVVCEGKLLGLEDKVLAGYIDVA